MCQLKEAESFDPTGLLSKINKKVRGYLIETASSF